MVGISSQDEIDDKEEQEELRLNSLLILLKSGSGEHMISSLLLGGFIKRKKALNLMDQKNSTFYVHLFLILMVKINEKIIYYLNIYNKE